MRVPGLFRSHVVKGADSCSLAGNSIVLGQIDRKPQIG